MAIEIEEKDFARLLALSKHCDGTNIKPPIFGEQTHNGITATFKPKEKFTLILNRKGHMRHDEFTIVMRSNSNGTMFRYDICGADHNGIPTPHLHIFDSMHNIGKNVIYGKELITLGLLTSVNNNYDIHFILDTCLPNFLEYNNVSIDKVIIDDTIL